MIESEDSIMMQMEKLLWYIRYNYISESPIIIYVNDTISTYKYKQNCPDLIKQFLKKRKIRNPWIRWFGKAMIEDFLMYLKTKHQGKRIHLNFVSLDREANIRAIQNLVWYISEKCSDICIYSWWGNIENYTATLTIQW